MALIKHIECTTCRDWQYQSTFLFFPLHSHRPSSRLVIAYLQNLDAAISREVYNVTDDDNVDGTRSSLRLPAKETCFKNHYSRRSGVEPLHTDNFWSGYVHTVM